MGWGGTKLERSSPWQSRSAIHSASLTSVLRPGTFLTCCVLATTIRNAPFQNGVDRLPVNSCALQRHMRAAFGEQPLAQTEQFSCGGAEGLKWSPRLRQANKTLFAVR